VPEFEVSSEIKIQANEDGSDNGDQIEFYRLKVQKHHSDDTGINTTKLTHKSCKLIPLYNSMLIHNNVMMKAPFDFVQTFVIVSRWNTTEVVFEVIFPTNTLPKYVVQHLT
jgi:hypothetical protein